MHVQPWISNSKGPPSLLPTLCDLAPSSGCLARKRKNIQGYTCFHCYRCHEEADSLLRLIWIWVWRVYREHFSSQILTALECRLGNVGDKRQTRALATRWVSV